MARSITILLALALDLIFGDPPNRLHPVVLMGRWLGWGRRLAGPWHRFWFGAVWVTLGAILFAGPWSLLKKANPSLFYQYLISPLLLKPVFAYRNLRQSVNDVAQALDKNDLPEARRLLSWHLVSRDTRDLTAGEVIGATIESLAENLTDSVTAPLLAFAIGGLPAAWAYRLVNTADAMWGYRTEEFEQLGKSAARLDDVLNWLPARMTGWLLVIAAAITGHNGRQAARTMLAQHHRPASPNAGWTMSAMAGALEVTLTKRGVYRLDGGRQSLAVSTIAQALRIADVCIGILVVSLGMILGIRFK